MTMVIMPPISRIALQDQIAELRREMLERAVVYGRLLRKGQMEAKIAERRNACLNAALRTLEQLREIERAREG
jgi:hypothetical protein